MSALTFQSPSSPDTGEINWLFVTVIVVLLAGALLYGYLVYKENRPFRIAASTSLSPEDAVRGVAARTFDPLVDAIGAGLSSITPADITGYYRHCGYRLSGQPL